MCTVHVTKYVKLFPSGEKTYLAIEWVHTKCKQMANFKEVSKSAKRHADNSGNYVAATMYFNLVVFRMSGYAWMSNFWCHFLIDGLLTNQIGALLPVHGRTEFGKMFGIDCRRFLLSSSPPPSRSPLPNCSQFFAHPRRAPSLACPEKERKRLLRRLMRSTFNAQPFYSHRRIVNRIVKNTVTTLLCGAMLNGMEPQYLLVWGNCGRTLSNKLQKLQNRAARVITSSGYDADVDSSFHKLSWKDFNLNVKFRKP